MVIFFGNLGLALIGIVGVLAFATNPNPWVHIIADLLDRLDGDIDAR